MKSIDKHLSQPTIEVWADITCPFCYIGEVLLGRAIEKLQITDRVKVEWKSCLLRPDWKLGESRTWTELLSEVKDMEVLQEYSKKMHLLEHLAGEYGLEYNLPNAYSHNAREAARLLKWAGERYGKVLELAQAFGRGYFSEALNMGESNNLLAKVEEVALPATEAYQILQSDAYLAEVEADQIEAITKAYNYVPTFYFNGEGMLEGLVTEEQLLRALEAL